MTEIRSQAMLDLLQRFDGERPLSALEWADRSQAAIADQLKFAAVQGHLAPVGSLTRDSGQKAIVYQITAEGVAARAAGINGAGRVRALIRHLPSTTGDLARLIRAETSVGYRTSIARASTLMERAERWGWVRPAGLGTTGWRWERTDAGDREVAA